SRISHAVRHQLHVQPLLHLLSLLLYPPSLLLPMLPITIPPLHSNAYLLPADPPVYEADVRPGAALSRAARAKVPYSTAFHNDLSVAGMRSLPRRSGLMCCL